MKQTNNDDILIIYGLLGSLVVIGYILMATNGNKNDLWSNRGANNIRGKWLTLYKIMIALSFIAGAYLIYYLYTYCPKNDPVIYTGSVLLLIFSAVWAFKPFVYSGVVLGLVFIGAILLLTGVCMLIKGDGNVDVLNSLAIAAMCIIVIQTGFFDFGIWTGNISVPML